MEPTNYNKEKKTRRKTIPELSSMMYGKVPPQAKELEEAVLGAIMLEKGAFDAAIEILNGDTFYVDANQKIFKAMQGLAIKSMPIDMLTVVQELKFREELDAVGGPYYVTKLTHSVVSSANIETHCRIILQMFIKRELIRISGITASNSFEDYTDAFDLLDEAEKLLFNLTNNNLRKNFTGIDNALVQTIQRIEGMRNREDILSGVTSGFLRLDQITYGWQNTDLIVLAARPSVGKSALGLNFALNAASDNINPVPVAFFSLEMSIGQCVQRILSCKSEIDLDKISRGRLSDAEMQSLYKKGIEPLSKVPIFLDDTAAINIFELRAKCRRLKAKFDIGLIIIDYLQLMSGTGENKNGNREQEISKVSRDLKALAKELQVPIIALSQLSREVEKRKDGSKMPQLSDLRESGAIEQDADMVMFIYRPEYYDITSSEFGESNKGETYVKIAKHRNGSLDTVKLRALLHIQKFESMEETSSFSNSGQSNQFPNQVSGFHPRDVSRTDGREFDDNNDDWKPSSSSPF